MGEYTFSFKVNEKNYTACFTIVEDESPKEVHVFDISPPDYSPELPYIFTINTESGDLNFALKDQQSAEFGVPISKAIMAKSKEIGMTLIDGTHHGHEHDNSI